MKVLATCSNAILEHYGFKDAIIRFDGRKCYLATITADKKSVIKLHKEFSSKKAAFNYWGIN